MPKSDKALSIRKKGKSWEFLRGSKFIMSSPSLSKLIKLIEGSASFDIESIVITELPENHYELKHQDELIADIINSCTLQA